MAGSDRYLESPCGRYVHLPGGLALPVEPILLCLDLEKRGIRLQRIGDDIDICPFSRLTREDKTALRHWKPHVLALLDHVEAASRHAKSAGSPAQNVMDGAGRGQGAAQGPGNNSRAEDGGLTP